MKTTRTPVVSRALLISLLALAVMAFAGASGAGPLGLIVSSEDPVVVQGDCPDEGDEVVVEDPDGDAQDGTEGEDGEAEGEAPEGEDGDDQGEDGDLEGEDPEGDTEECEAVEEETEGEDEGTPVDTESREGECSEAAGLVDEEGNARTVDDVYGDLDAPFGQTHSMEVLLANCMKNPQAPGLLRALEVHKRNLERWEARAEMRAEREAAKAERKAAHEAAKAERMAAHEAAKAARAAAKVASGHGNGH